MPNKRVLAGALALALVSVACGGGSTTPTTLASTAPAVSTGSTTPPSIISTATTTPQSIISTSTTMLEGREVATDRLYVEPAAGEASDRLLDVYVPVVADGAVVVLLHGGGATKDDAAVIGVATRLADAGLVVIVPTHAAGSTPNALVADDGRRMREAFENVFCAIRYASAHAADFGGDPSRILLVGQSAGGFLGVISFLGGADVERGWVEFEQDGGPPRQVRCVADGDLPHLTGFVGYNAAAFVFLMGGLPEGDPELWGLADPRSRTSSGSGSIRLITGGSDRLTPAWHQEEVELFVAELRDIGRDADTVFIEDAPHGWVTEGPIWEITRDTILSLALP